MHTFPLAIPGNLGNVEGAGADGVLAGYLAPTAGAKALLETHALAGICITDDGGTYVIDTTDFGDAGANDVAPLPATPAVDDACYFGESTKTFKQVDILIGTQGAGTWTVTWEYWNGSAWTSLAGVTDGTTGFTAATGWVTTSWTVPTDWATCTVDGVLGYYVRARVSAYTSVTTQPLLTQGYVIAVAGSASWSDDTTDFNSAAATDVPLLPAYAVVGDAFYVSHATEKFCKLELNIATAGVGTWTVLWEYWNGTAWAALATVEDDSAGFTTGTSTYLVHFVPPTDWTLNTAANGPNSNAGYFIRGRLSALTTYTTAPVGTQGWIYPLMTGADGMPYPSAGQGISVKMVAMNAGTASASNADSIFLLVNVSTGAYASFTWTQADPVDNAAIALAFSANQKLALVQITEDGTTEFADASFAFSD